MNDLLLAGLATWVLWSIYSMVHHARPRPRYLWECHKCGFRFPTQGHLNEHLARDHDDESHLSTHKETA